MSVFGINLRLNKSKICESRCVKDAMSDVWEEFVALEDRDDLAFKYFNPLNKETLKERNQKLNEEKVEQASSCCQYRQMTIFDYF